MTTAFVTARGRRIPAVSTRTRPEKPRTKRSVRVWRRVVLLVCAASAAVALRTAPAGATNGHWQPADVFPTHATIETVRALYDGARPDADRARDTRVERYRLTTGAQSLTATVAMLHDDFRVTTVAGGATYESGRSAGRRWRRTPRGVVRIVESDVQGDDLDRWPVDVVGFRFAECTIVGETRGSEPAYVVGYAPDGEIPHWLYVDERTGLVRREVSRDGSRVVTYAFDDIRSDRGLLRPFRWSVSGTGAADDATVERVVDAPGTEPDTATAADVAIPATDSATTFPLDPERTLQIPATFSHGRITIDVDVDGRKATFALDTGTTQLLLDAGFAHRAGMMQTLGHAIASHVTVGPIAATSVPFELAGLGADYHCDGLLGNDFFVGRIVHIDYRHGRVEAIPRPLFARPPAAVDIPVSYDEGIPLAGGRISGVSVKRFALDTGSSHVLVPRYFAEHDGDGHDPVTLDHGRSTVARFLEGTIEVEPAILADVAVGPFRIRDGRVDLETHGDNGTIDIPLDAIVGTDVLSVLDLWFDYDGGKLYAKPF